MDPKSIGDWLSGEIGVASHVSFWVAVLVVGLVSWRLMEWRYRAILDGYGERLELRDEKLAYLEQQRQREIVEAAPSAKSRSTPNSETVQQTNVEAHEAEQSEPKTFVSDSIDPDFLRGLYSDHTSIQAEKLLAAYKGKWMRVEGDVVNVTAQPDGGAMISIMKTGTKMGTRESLRNVYLLTSSGDPRAGMLQRGETIRAEGKIRSVSAFDVTLDPAEIV